MIQLEEKEHSTFQRHGKDLTMRLDIDVAEALCGMRRAVTTLDGRWGPKNGILNSCLEIINSILYSFIL